MLNRISRGKTKHRDRPAARAMLLSAGLTEDELGRPHIGIVSFGHGDNPCNMHLTGLAAAAREGVRPSDAIGFVSDSIGASDRISMGTFGMRFVASFAQPGRGFDRDDHVANAELRRAGRTRREPRP